MGLGQAAVELSEPVQLPLLQLGGEFIELAILFLLLAIVAGILGAGGVAGFSMEVAKWLVIIFVVLAVISFLL